MLMSVFCVSGLGLNSVAGAQTLVSRSSRDARVNGRRDVRRVAYLKPHPVPPSTMAATRMAPAMEPIIRLVALGPAKGYGGKKT